MSNAKHTLGPWVWTTNHSGPPDEYGCSTRGPVDLATFEPQGYVGNPELYAGEQCIISAGSGEYNPIDGASPEEELANAHLIAAAPDLLAALTEAMGYLSSFENNADPTADAMVDRCRAAIAKAKGESK